MPSLGAKALAALIECNTPLQRLNAGWNSLRGKAAELVGKSLAANSYLVSVEFGWNGLADGGAEWLAESIRECQYLQYVGLANNSIGERGAYVLADCLKENNGVRFMKLDGNPIGQHGMRAVLRAIRDICTFGWSRRVSFAKCNITVTDEKQKFLDRRRPGGVWECDLSKPFERATAWELVDLAWTQPGQNWEDETLDGKPFDLPEPGEKEVWTRDDYSLPKEGVLKVKYIASPRVPRLDDAVSEELCDRIVRHISNSVGEGLTIMESACGEFFFTAAQAGFMLALFKDSTSKVDCAQALLPRIVDWTNVTSQLFDWLTAHEMQMLQSPANAGQLFDFVPNNPTGHYRLNLVNPIERQIATYMMGVSCEDEAKRRAHKGEIINTSQKGDWDNFRNEKLTSSYAEGDYADANGNPIYSGATRQTSVWRHGQICGDQICGAGAPFDINDENLEPFPPTGVLEFDYVSTDIAHRIADQPPMHLAVFEQLLQDMDEIWHSITVYEHAASLSWSGTPADSTAAGEEPTTILHDDLARTQPDKPKTPDTPNKQHRGRSKAAHPKRLKNKKRMTKKEQIQSLPKDEASAVHIQSLWRGWFGRMHVMSVRKLAVLHMRKQQERSAEASRQKSLEKARRLAKVREREAKKFQERTASRQQMLGKLVHVVDHSLTDHALGHDKDEEDSAQINAALQNVSSVFWHKRQRAHRQCWWLPKELRKMLCMTQEEREHRIGARCCKMLRRATLEHYFSVKQLEHVLRIIPRSHRIEAIVTTWSKLSDLENFSIYDFVGYDFTARQNSHTASTTNLNAMMEEAVSFQWKNPDFLLKNPDFLLKEC